MAIENHSRLTVRCPAISYMLQGVGLSDVDLKGLFLKHAAALRGYLARRVRDPQLAADLVQESFLRLAEQTRGAPIDNSQGYLYRTANNLLIDHVRQEARRKTETVPHEVLAEIEDDGAGLEAQAMAQQQRMALKQAVAELPERTREIFRLNRIEGMTHAEVARCLNISDSSVQKHLSKALAYVMQRLQATDGRPADE